MRYLLKRRNLNLPIGLIILTVGLSILTSCSRTQPQIKCPPKVWWGNKGDIQAWEEAKVVMENYSWVVTARE